ncbi:DNA binding protein [Halogeometricum borinquense DSM 11551]|uniref:DNA binding protein n=1 Tax=Halogeometricum borinquense (strain ATCC 700274 / DSM 11551 / JCM 10706 / KCTC 4070 / PR3) TaxID=469382 RepID=L9V3L6_HALBP|nr:helix-turn-helix domain-containing protein [Halogeometricum borinquense]ELY31795.1 DNA binding protein [Halogeometricum borinquense DSM 11551]
MLEYTFRIRHEGCWTENLNDRFPDISAAIIYSYRLLGISITMIEATNVSDADAFVEWLNDHEVMTVAQLVSYDADRETAFVSLAGDYETDTEPVLNVLLRNRCFPTVPATVTGGREHWSVIASDHEQVSRTHEELQKIGHVEVDSLRTPELDRLLTGLSEVKQAVQDLSPRQREVLGRAIDEGYYDSPRGCNIADLAEQDTANTSTVGEHLRRSEAKILKAVAPLLSRPKRNKETGRNRKTKP